MTTRTTLIQERGERWVAVDEAAEAFLEIVNANAVDCLFIMPGTDTFPIQEALAKYQARGARTPRVITALHESLAMSAAHGHFLVSSRPQVVLVHVDVGLQMVGGMLHNAQRGRAGVVLCSGRTPITGHGELRGGRNREVHWIQDRRDQPSIVRDYVKWYYELTRHENLNHVVQRAFQVAATEPCGPVYVSFLRELLMERIDGFSLLPPERYGPVHPPVPAPRDLEHVARLIAGAQRPLMLTGYTGRSAAGFGALSAFADALAIPVYVRPERAHLATDHPMYLGTEPGAALEQADLVLLLDIDVPYTPVLHRPPDDATIVQIDIDPLKIDFPVWGFPIDIALQGDTSRTLPALQAAVEERLDAAARARLTERHAAVRARHLAWRQSVVEAAERGRSRTPISVDWASHCVAALVDDATIVVDDAITSSFVAARHIPISGPGTYFKGGGSSMGWGSGAALGVKLAAPDRTVINLNADGNFVDGNPEAALWAYQAYDAPVLTVVYNNGQYAAVKRNLLTDYPEGHAARTGNFPGVHIPEPPDFQYVARACRAYGERVEDPGALPDALRRGLDAVRHGQAAVIDVIIEGP